MRTLRRPLLATAAVSLFFNTACYAYLPAPATEAKPATIVRLRLTPEGTDGMARYLGPNVVAVTGTVTEALSNGTLMVSPQMMTMSNRAEQPWVGDGSVPFPQAFVASLERRVFNRNRTVAATVLITTGLVALATTALRTVGSQGTLSPGGAPPP